MAPPLTTAADRGQVTGRPLPKQADVVVIGGAKKVTEDIVKAFGH